MSFDAVIKHGSKISRRARGRSLITAATLLAISISSVEIPAATYEAAVGAIATTGLVRVNGAVVVSGQTMFGQSNIQTSIDSDTIIDFKNLAHLHVGPQSLLTIDASPTQVSVILSAGHVSCSVPKGTSLSLRTSDSSISTDSNQAAVFDVEGTDCDGTTISVLAGQLKVSGSAGQRVLMAGDSLATGATAPPAIHAKNKAGLFILGGMAAGLILAAIIGRQPQPETAFPGGCIDLLSGQSNCR